MVRKFFRDMKDSLYEGKEMIVGMYDKETNMSFDFSFPFHDWSNENNVLTITSLSSGEFSIDTKEIKEFKYDVVNDQYIVSTEHRDISIVFV